MHLSRTKVVSIHVVLSAAILGGLLLVMALFWYPKGLFSVAGGWQGLKILAPIDLVLGPLLTLFFYRPGKKGVLRDLAMIGVVQIAALSYGMHAVHSQRPVALVFAEGAFVAVTPTEIREANSTLLAKEYETIDPRTLSQSAPAVVVARPVPKEQLGQYMASLFNGMPELAFRSDRYESVELHRDMLMQSAVDAGDTASPDGETWFPLKTKYGNGVLRLDLESALLIASRRQFDDTVPVTKALQLPAESSD